MSWQDRLKLNIGEKLKFKETFAAGSLGQKERNRYDIIDQDGNKVGSVQYNENTSIKAPFKSDYSVIQYDKNNNEVFRDSWND